MFKDINAEIKYLKDSLLKFEKFMNDNGYRTDNTPCLFMSNPTVDCKSRTIQELYMNFKMYVIGYCGIYEEAKK